MESVKIKYEKKVTDCQECIFHKWFEYGCTSSMIGTYYKSYCNKIKEYIDIHKKMYDLDDDLILIIPNKCPFKK